MRARGQQRELTADVNTESCVSRWLCSPPAQPYLIPVLIIPREVALATLSVQYASMAAEQDGST